VRRIIRVLDDALEGVATFLYGPIPEGEERPTLWAKVSVFAMLAALVAIGIAATWRW
jgi:hypothetical protein